MILIQRPGQTAFKDLLESDTINIEKLKQYVQKNSIVAEFKPLCWKILLGLTNSYVHKKFICYLRYQITLSCNTSIC